jgi:hypothetical protein
VRSCGTCRPHLAPPGVRERSWVIQCQLLFRAADGHDLSTLPSRPATTRPRGSARTIQIAPLGSSHGRSPDCFVGCALCVWPLAEVPRAYGFYAMRLPSSTPGITTAFLQSPHRLTRASSINEKRVITTIGTSQSVSSQLRCDIRFHVKHTPVCPRYRFRSQRKQHRVLHLRPIDCSGFHSLPLQTSTNS